MNLSKDQVELLFVVLQKYATMSAGRLVFLTHAEEPWNKARENYAPFDLCDEKISHDLMRDYYRKRIQK